jgi:hypothetical protein
MTMESISRNDACSGDTPGICEGRGGFARRWEFQILEYTNQSQSSLAARLGGESPSEKPAPTTPLGHFLETHCRLPFPFAHRGTETRSRQFFNRKPGKQERNSGDWVYLLLLRFLHSWLPYFCLLRASVAFWLSPTGGFSENGKNCEKRLIIGQ